MESALYSVYTLVVLYQKSHSFASRTCSISDTSPRSNLYFRDVVSLTRRNYNFPSGHFLYNFTLDNLSFR